MNRSSSGDAFLVGFILGFLLCMGMLVVTGVIG